jgi:hypothetical protein
LSDGFGGPHFFSRPGAIGFRSALSQCRIRRGGCFSFAGGVRLELGWRRAALAKVYLRGTFMLENRAGTHHTKRDGRFVRKDRRAVFTVFNLSGTEGHEPRREIHKGHRALLGLAEVAGGPLRLRYPANRDRAVMSNLRRHLVDSTFGRVRSRVDWIRRVAVILDHNRVRIDKPQIRWRRSFRHRVGAGTRGGVRYPRSLTTDTLTTDHEAFIARLDAALGEMRPYVESHGGRSTHRMAAGGRAGEAAARRQLPRLPMSMVTIKLGIGAF